MVGKWTKIESTPQRLPAVESGVVRLTSMAIVGFRTSASSLSDQTSIVARQAPTVWLKIPID